VKRLPCVLSTTFDIGRRIGILPRMPSRGSRVSAVAWVAALSVLTAAGAAGCDSHSKPTVPTEAPQSPDPVVAPPSPSSGSASVPASSNTAPPVSAPPTTEITGVAALTSAYPSAAAAEPAAIAVVRQFFDGLNHEIDTGDENAVSATFTSQCVKCIQDVVDIKKELPGGHTLRGAHLHLVSVDVVAPTYATLVRVIVTQAEDGGEELDKNGTTVASFPSSSPLQFAYEVDITKQPPRIVQSTRISA